MIFSLFLLQISLQSWHAKNPTLDLNEITAFLTSFIQTLYRLFLTREWKLLHEHSNSHSNLNPSVSEAKNSFLINFYLFFHEENFSFIFFFVWDASCCQDNPSQCRQSDDQRLICCEYTYIIYMEGKAKLWLETNRMSFKLVRIFILPHSQLVTCVENENV